MSVITYNTFIAKLFNELDVLLHSFVNNSYSTLAHHLQKPLALAVVIYVVILGYAIANGWVRCSMGNLMKSVFKVGLIYVFAMNWDNFSRLVVNGIEGGTSEIAGWLMNGVNHGVFAFGNDSVNMALQKVFSEFTRIGDLLWAKGSWHAMGPLFDAMMVWACGLALISIAVFEIALAKIMLSILFGTAPLFIGFTLFKPTHGFFDRWLGAIVGYAFLFIFVSMTLALALTITEWSLGGILVGKVLHFSLVGWLPIAVVAFLGIGIILKASHMAQSIGGTVTTASGASMVAGAIGGAIGGVTAGMSLARGGLSTYRAGMVAANSSVKVADAMKKFFLGDKGSANNKFSGLQRTIRQGDKSS